RLVLLGGVVDEDVEPTELVDGLPDGVAAELGVCDVAPEQEGPPALLLDLRLDLLGVPVLLEVDDRDVGALLGEVHGHGPADAAVASGDDGAHPVELPGRLVALSRVLGLRPHLMLAAGLVLLLLWWLALPLLPVAHGFTPFRGLQNGRQRGHGNDDARVGSPRRERRSSGRRR